MKVRPERDVTEIAGHFLSEPEAVVTHWVEHSKGLLLFVMGVARPGECCSYDRKKRTFGLLQLAESVFGGYLLIDMRQKIKDVRLLDFAEDSSRPRRPRLAVTRFALRPGRRENSIPAPRWITCSCGRTREGRQIMATDGLGSVIGLLRCGTNSVERIEGFGNHCALQARARLFDARSSRDRIFMPA
ncbi:MAG: hypothetical protein JNL98_34985 [Bryobacterales bacterium]|nr:hypothetical protein [Bryobacterales bacterium]